MEYSHEKILYGFQIIGSDKSQVCVKINMSIKKQGEQIIMNEGTAKRVISFSPPDISELEIAEVCEALRSGWITTGPRAKMLECRLVAYIETGETDVDCTCREAIAKHSQKVVCLNSATAAEELNLRILGVGPGDEGIAI